MKLFHIEIIRSSKETWWNHIFLRMFYMCRVLTFLRCVMCVAILCVCASFCLIYSVLQAWQSTFVIWNPDRNRLISYFCVYVNCVSSSNWTGHGECGPQVFVETCLLPDWRLELLLESFQSAWSLRQMSFYREVNSLESSYDNLCLRWELFIEQTDCVLVLPISSKLGSWLLCYAAEGSVGCETYCNRLTD